MNEDEKMHQKFFKDNMTIMITLGFVIISAMISFNEGDCKKAREEYKKINYCAVDNVYNGRCSNLVLDYKERQNCCFSESTFKFYKNAK